MPHFIVKPDPDKDEYVEWSTVVDMPGRPHPRPEDPDPATAVRYDRADQNGTSALWPHLAASEQPFGWSDVEFLIGWPYGENYPDEHDAFVKRRDLPELGRRSVEGIDYNDLIDFKPWEN